MRYLIDTTAFSLYRNQHPKTVELFNIAEAIVMTPIVLGELRYGYLNGTKQAENEQALLKFLEFPRVGVVPLDEETSLYYALIRTGMRRAGIPISPNDLWIAASAMQHGLTILTADSDFQMISQVLVELLS